MLSAVAQKTSPLWMVSLEPFAFCRIMNGLLCSVVISLDRETESVTNRSSVACLVSGSEPVDNIQE